MHSRPWNASISKNSLSGLRMSAVEVGFPTQRNATQRVRCRSSKQVVAFGISSSRVRHKVEIDINIISRWLPPRESVVTRTTMADDLRHTVVRSGVARVCRVQQKIHAMIMQQTFSKHYYNYFMALSSPLMRQNQAIQSRALASAITLSSIHYLTTNAV